MTSTRRAGTVPITNMMRHDSWTVPARTMTASVIPTRAAVTLPSAERAWSQPSANGLARSGMVSATSDTPTANCPPTPRPVRNRYRAKSQKPVETALRPVKIE